MINGEEYMIMRSLAVVMLLLLLLSLGSFVAAGAKIGVSVLDRTPPQLLFYTISLLSLAVFCVFLASFCWLKITEDNKKKEKNEELKKHLETIDREWDQNFGRHSGLRQRR